MIHTVKSVTVLFALCSLASLLPAPLLHPPLTCAPLPLTLTLHLSSTAVHLRWPRSDFCAITFFSGKWFQVICNRTLLKWKFSFDLCVSCRGVCLSWVFVHTQMIMWWSVHGWHPPVILGVLLIQLDSSRGRHLQFKAASAVLSRDRKQVSAASALHLYTKGRMEIEFQKNAEHRV